MANTHGFEMPSPDFINQKECFNFVKHNSTLFTQTECEMNSIKSLQELEIAQRNILSKQPSFTLEQAKAQVERLKKQSTKNRNEQIAIILEDLYDEYVVTNQGVFFY